MPVSAGRKFGLLNLAEFVIAVESFNANVDISLVRRAYSFAERAHRGQKRQSGDPYVIHSIQTALILAEQHLDSTTIAAGLLHDVVEDTDVTLEDIKNEFGEEIRELVDGVTRISSYSATSAVESQAEGFRKMLLSTARDIRVILIKLADRLHNMRTLKHMPVEKQKSIALETYEVFAPLAHRFGMAKIKWELEDLSLSYLNPERYNYILKKIEESLPESEAFIAEVTEPIREALKRAGLEASVYGRAKSIDAISRKMDKLQCKFEDISDKLAIRLIVKTVEECYMALGLVHQIFRPTGVGFDDYIANPKANGYQSLHTNVKSKHGNEFEIQIRTESMHRNAAYGIAAHWLYKEGRKELGPTDKQYNWLSEVLDWQKDATSPSEFLEYLKIDLFHDEVFVFTPNGDLKSLPDGSTALDFAFAVHTNVGLKCSGTRINGRLVPISTRLNSGDKVEVITSSNQEPSRDWLKIVHTSKARSKIRRFLKLKGYEQSVVLGKEMLEKALRKKSVKFPSEDELTDCGQALGFDTVEALHAGLGQGDVSVESLMSKLFPTVEEAPRESIVKRFLDRARGTKGVRIQDLDNLMFRFAQCCQPVPGERIIGFVTRGRGISIHRADCPVALRMSDEKERMVDVEWDVGKDDEFLVRIEMIVDDRKNMLRDVLESIASEDVNIRDAEMKTQEGTAHGKLVLEIRNLKQLQRVVDRIKRTKGVISVWRSQGGEE